MRLDLLLCRFSVAVGALLIALPSTAQTSKPQPLVIPLACAGGGALGVAPDYYSSSVCVMR